MGPYHEFLLLNRDTYPFHQYIYNDIKDIRHNAVLLDHDLIMYMLDTLLWIPNTGKEIGLNLYGITTIEQAQASYFKNIINSWFALFSLAPKEEFKLTGGWIVDEDNQDDGYFDKLIFSKQDVLPKLKVISNMAEKVSMNKDLYILHLGV